MEAVKTFQGRLYELYRRIHANTTSENAVSKMFNTVTTSNEESILYKSYTNNMHTQMSCVVIQMVQTSSYIETSMADKLTVSVSLHWETK